MRLASRAVSPLVAAPSPLALLTPLPPARVVSSTHLLSKLDNHLHLSQSSLAARLTPSRPVARVVSPPTKCAL
jgi:hypothetical protein